MNKNRKFVLVAIGLIAILTVCFVNSRDSGGQELEPVKSRLLQSQPIVIDANADILSRLRTERRNASLQSLQATSQLYLHGRGSLNDVIASVERALPAQLDSPDANKQLVLEEHVEFARGLEKVTSERYAQGVADAAQLAIAKYWRLEVDVQFEREAKVSKK